MKDFGISFGYLFEFNGSIMKHIYLHPNIGMNYLYGTTESYDYTDHMYYLSINLNAGVYLTKEIALFYTIQPGYGRFHQQKNGAIINGAITNIRWRVWTFPRMGLGLSFQLNPRKKES